MAAAGSDATLLASLPHPGRPSALQPSCTSSCHVPAEQGASRAKGLWNDTSVRELRCCEDVTACEKGKQKGAKEKKNHTHKKTVLVPHSSPSTVSPCAEASEVWTHPVYIWHPDGGAERGWRLRSSWRSAGRAAWRRPQHGRTAHLPWWHHPWGWGEAAAGGGRRRQLPAAGQREHPGSLLPLRAVSAAGPAPLPSPSTGSRAAGLGAGCQEGLVRQWLISNLRIQSMGCFHIVMIKYVLILPFADTCETFGSLNLT